MIFFHQNKITKMFKEKNVHTTMPTFLLKRNLRTKTKKFYDGWTKEDFEKEYLKISMNISTLTKVQRQFIINSFKNAKDKNNKTLDNTDK